MTPAVLVVDDSLTVRMDLVEAFEAEGLVAVGCRDLAGAREALAQRAFDVVVLDLQLPDGDGLELLADLRRDGAQVPKVLLLSSHADVADRLKGLKTGADDYVGKPYDKGYVLSRVHQLAGRESRREENPNAPRILLVEDSETFAFELRKALEGAGYLVSRAVNGEEGLRMAAEDPPSLVIADGVLPGIDGFTVVRRMRLDAALTHVPCVMLTGSESGRAEIEAYEAGADAYIRKEEGFDVILARLKVARKGATDRPRAQFPEAILGPKRILAVDDSPTYLNALSDALRNEGYDVILARSGEEALDLLAVQRVDCILLDVVMPGLGGHATCRRIKGAPGVRDIPLIMLTAADGREATLGGLGAGADDYISKGADFEVLRARLRAQLRRRQADEESRLYRQRLVRAEIEAAEARAAAELAETRAELIAELERRNRELEAFSYSVSHDLRAPLRAIHGYSTLLQSSEAGTLEEEGRRWLESLRTAAARMSELIDDILSLSRVGRAELKRQSVDLSAAAAEVAAELRQAEPGRDVALDVEPGLLVEGDPQLLRIVLTNLLSNAWKFTGRRSDARVAIGRTTLGDSTAFFVRDNGAGFDESRSERLFQPFQRLHTEREFPGTGIGLTIVHRIVERHGGRVVAEGREGEGATITFTLPPRAPSRLAI